MMFKYLHIVLSLLMVTQPLSVYGSEPSLPTSLQVALQVEQQIDRLEHPLPVIEPLFDAHLRNVSICKAPDGSYYLTGTTDDNWGVSEGIRVWQSDDLKNWKQLGEHGFVWTFEHDGYPWQREIGYDGRWKQHYRAIWAPEIHFFNGTFWIPYSVSNIQCSGLLKSVSGKAEGPYVDILPDAPLVEGIDATLVETETGDIYYVWAHGRVRKMKADLSGFDGSELTPLFTEDGSKVGFQGVSLFRYGGKYHLIAAEWNSEGPKNGHELRNTFKNRRAADGRYDCMIAVSENLLGPYSKSYIAIPHGGHNSFFTDHEGGIWATLFGDDEAAAPFRENPGIVPMQYDAASSIFNPVLPTALQPPFDCRILYVDAASSDDRPDGSSWLGAFRSIQAAIDAAGHAPVEIRIREGIYDAFSLTDTFGVRLLGGFSGQSPSDTRDPEHFPTYIRPRAERVQGIRLHQASYTRLDGLTIEGFGRPETMGSSNRVDGAALHVAGGGESTRIVNCVFRNNLSTGHGGAVAIAASSSPLFINCAFVNNESHRNGGAVAIDMDGSNGYHLRFYNCQFLGNFSQHHGGVAYVRTIQKQTGLLRMINCELRDNRSLLEKGILAMDGGSNLLLSHCEILNNRGMAQGAVIASLGRVPAQNRIINCVIAGNQGGFLFGGDGFAPDFGHPWGTNDRAWTEFENNAFSGNQTGAILRRIYDAQQWITITELNASLMGENNISLDPNFDRAVLKDRGTMSSSFPIDMLGHARVGDFYDAPDIGGTEYREANPSVEPLKASDRP